LVVTFQDSLTDRIENQLPLVQAHTLVVRGERDALVPQRWAERVVRLLPDAELAIIPHAAHTVAFTDADKVAAAILRFVGSGA
jgi:pimeloyl-ACP methyl ester carboxylesterase